MIDIPGSPTAPLVMTDEHKKQAAALIQSVKDANPGHPFFEHIEAATKSVGRDAVDTLDGIIMLPLIALLLIGGRSNAFM
jgi:hypothetical protein